MDELRKTIELLKASKPGYGLLTKRRGQCAMILDKPIKLNSRIKKVEEEECFH
jgi:hypothetical protein